MNEHATWYDFLSYLPGYEGMMQVLEHQFGRSAGTARPWSLLMFQETRFTMTHVFATTTVSIFLVIGAIIYGRSLRGGTRGVIPPPTFSLRNLFEMICEMVLKLATEIMGKKDARRFLPLIGSLAFFIFFSNFTALLPGFAPPTADLKTNLALALVVFFATHIFGVKEHGLAYFKHFLGPKLYLAPLMLPIELISHIARPISLSLRLMGNMFADHKVVASFFALVPLALPIPFLVLGLIVVTVQTLVFCLLTMVYISMAVAHEH